MQLKTASERTTAGSPAAASSLQAMRQLPIRWRVLSLAALNAIVVFVFAAVIWDGARVLTDARNELRQTRDSDRLLTQLESDAVRLQGLIHRYFTQPNVDLLMEITGLRETVMTTLKVHAAADPILKGAAEPLVVATERFVAGFSDLRNVQSAIATAYENQVLRAVHEMSGLYAIMENGTREQGSLIWPTLSKSRESFSTTLVLTNAYYLTQTRDIAEEILKNLDAIEGTIPVMLDLADNDLQRGALGALAYRIVSWRLGVANLTEHFTTRSHLLREEIDGNQQMIARIIDTLSDDMRRRERIAYERFENALANMYMRIAIASFATGVVERNRRSPATALNETRYGNEPAAGSDPEAPPEWEEVASGGEYAWHDHRIHWMTLDDPAVAPGEVVLEWTVPLTVDGESVEVEGTLVREAPVSPWPWVALAVAVAGALVAFGWRRKGWATIGPAAVTVLVCSAVATTSAGSKSYAGAHRDRSVAARRSPGRRARRRRRLGRGGSAVFALKPPCVGDQHSGKVIEIARSARQAAAARESTPS